MHFEELGFEDCHIENIHKIFHLSNHNKSTCSTIGIKGIFKILKQKTALVQIYTKIL